MEPERPKTTVFFDGSCPLCRAEIGYYRRKDVEAALAFVDVSQPGAETPQGMSCARAMARFHVRTLEGRIVSGAAGFVEVWRHLPNWRWAARLAGLPGALPALEWGYRVFLPVRPFLSRLAGRVLSGRNER
jgi:predicted DCC family thiol-disulfide oxidoreductase YuxK